MKFNVLNSASFEDGMQDALGVLEQNGVNPNVDRVSVYMEMNGQYTHDNKACVDIRVYVNETPEVIGNDIALNGPAD